MRFALLPLCWILSTSSAISRPIPITATATAANEQIHYGDSIVIELSLAHELDGVVRLTAFALEPQSWHAEVWTVQLVQVRRLPDNTPILPRSPHVSPPERFSGPNYHDINPGETLTLIHDAGKWEIPGGWTPGSYELLFSISNVTVEPYFEMKVYCDPIFISITSVPEQEGDG